MRALLWITNICLGLATNQLSAQATDTAKVAKPEIFELAFSLSVKEQDDQHYIFAAKNLGEILVTSGKLVLTDVDGIGKTASFIESFPTGKFPIQIALVREFTDTSNFLAYGRVVFSNEPVVKWEYALKPTEKYILPGDTSWTGCLMDSSYHWVMLLADSSAYNSFTEQRRNFPSDLVENFNNFSLKTFIYQFDKHMIFAFHGQYMPCYSAYIGYDRNGRICRFLIDTGNFQIPRSFFK